MTAQQQEARMKFDNIHTKISSMFGDDDININLQLEQWMLIQLH
jgi:hypothetical protein